MWYQGPNEVERLKHALYSARRTILSLLRPDVQERLESYYALRTWADYHRWEHETIAHFEETALAIPRTENSYLGLRAYCPLCSASSSSPYQDGFSLPEGLHRHLRGWGNTRQCDVLEHTFDMVRDARREAFDKAEAEEKAQKESALAERRKAEWLFDLGPSGGARLIDEGLDWNTKPRDAADILWVEQRLERLGFEKIEKARTRKYVKQLSDYIAYADPRIAGRIRVFVYAAAAPPRRGRARQGVRVQSFEVLDSWRNDLEGKLQARVAGAIDQLTAKSKRPGAAR